MVGDQGSRRGHHCSEAALTDIPSSKVWVAPRGATHPLEPRGATDKQHGRGHA
jgi:hypothetical protein